MDYFDTDVIVHAIVRQDEGKHEYSKMLVFDALETGRLLISTLSIQEIGYVLSRFSLPSSDISENLRFFVNQTPATIEALHLQRGMLLAESLGYRNINDCIHTAVAEAWHCDI